ncbi:MAG: alpha-amylase family glycosyl hydrolase, partial [Actinomycetales bacterium]
VLDIRRSLQPDWLQLPGMVGYAAYTERFADNLRGVEDKIPYLRELGVTYLHLMPLLEPRVGDNDGGYAVRDYRAVRSDLGTVDDLRDLATTLRENGMSLVLDAPEVVGEPLGVGGVAHHPRQLEPVGLQRTPDVEDVQVVRTLNERLMGQADQTVCERERRVVPVQRLQGLDEVAAASLDAKLEELLAVCADGHAPNPTAPASLRGRPRHRLSACRESERGISVHHPH